MKTLHDLFEASVKQLHLKVLPCDLAAAAPAALQFAIGGTEKIYLGDHRKPNGAYVENAVDRALAIYRNLPAAPDILRIDDCPELVIPGLPDPDEEFANSRYWRLPAEPPFLTRLLRAIIRAELDSSGYAELTSNVYFLNSRESLLFCLYDDRSAAVAAPGMALLESLHGLPDEWILTEDAQ